MANPEKPEAPERRDAPEGRETPTMGGRKGRKVRPIKGEPAIDRPYDPGTGKQKPDDPWQDPGGAEPGNG
ncbi:MAG: hypothetical protein FJ027_01100 [Candidatus Rokubacteria bacterium]|nr:hypothetical protein [Candidatus Rokubacteria bacterium]